MGSGTAQFRIYLFGSAYLQPTAKGASIWRSSTGLGTKLLVSLLDTVGVSGDKCAQSNDSAVGARPVKRTALSMFGKPGSICRHILASRKEYVKDVFRVSRGFLINGGLGMQILLCPVTL
jgi:hypothetical protein